MDPTATLHIPGSFFDYLKTATLTEGQDGPDRAAARAACVQATRHGGPHNCRYQVTAGREALDWILRQTALFLTHGSISAQTQTQRRGARTTQGRASVALKDLAGAEATEPRRPAT